MKYLIRAGREFCELRFKVTGWLLLSDRGKLAEIWVPIPFRLTMTILDASISQNCREDEECGGYWMHESQREMSQGSQRGEFGNCLTRQLKPRVGILLFFLKVMTRIRKLMPLLTIHCSMGVRFFTFCFRTELCPLSCGWKHREVWVGAWGGRLTVEFLVFSF